MLGCKLADARVQRKEGRKEGRRGLISPRRTRSLFRKIARVLSSNSCTVCTELAKKVCPRLPDLATAPAGGITQPSTNFFGQLCSRRVREHTLGIRSLSTILFGINSTLVKGMTHARLTSNARIILSTCRWRRKFTTTSRRRGQIPRDPRGSGTLLHLLPGIQGANSIG